MMAKKRSKYSAAARRFVSSEIKKLVRRGYAEPRAVAASLSTARRKGYKVPALRNAGSWLAGVFAGTKPKRKTAKRTRRSQPRSNSGRVVIGDSALELRYEGGHGKRKGNMRGPWKHVFELDDVEVIGEKDGSVRLKSKSGERLWDHFEV